MISFSVEGQPVPMARPRTVRNNGKVRTYNPEKSTNYKTAVKLKAIAKMKREMLTPTDKLVELDVSFYFKPPKSTPKYKLKQITDNAVLYPVHKDIDNLVKSVMDAMNKVVYIDDKQVVQLKANKYYGMEERTEIKVTIIE